MTCWATYALGQRHLDQLEELLEHRVAGGTPCSRRLPRQLGAHVGGELVDGVELGGQLGEVVVELGQLLLLDLARR